MIHEDETDIPFDVKGNLKRESRTFIHEACGAAIVTMLEKPKACHEDQGGCGRKRGPWREVLGA